MNEQVTDRMADSDFVGYLSQARSGLLDGDLALVLHPRPHADGLAGHVAATVQSDAARYGALGETRHAQAVLNLAVERLL